MDVEIIWEFVKGIFVFSARFFRYFTRRGDE